MSLPSLWQSLIQTTSKCMKNLSWTCSCRRSAYRRSAPCAMLFVLQWCQSYLLITLKSASFKCPLLDLTLIRTIVLFIGSLKISSLVLPYIHRLNGTIKQRTGGNLLNIGPTTTMVPVSLVRAPLWRNRKPRAYIIKTNATCRLRITRSYWLSASRLWIRTRTRNCRIYKR